MAADKRVRDYLKSAAESIAKKAMLGRMPTFQHACSTDSEFRQWICEDKEKKHNKAKCSWCTVFTVAHGWPRTRCIIIAQISSESTSAVQLAKAFPQLALPAYLECYETEFMDYLVANLSSMVADSHYNDYWHCIVQNPTRLDREYTFLWLVKFAHILFALHIERQK